MLGRWEAGQLEQMRPLEGPWLDKWHLLNEVTEGPRQAAVTSLMGRARVGE